MLTIRNVSKTYGSSAEKAVDNLSFEVKPGEIFGFLGPNGAGKTTTIKMITGIMSPDKGDVSVGGIDMCSNPLAAKQKIGYVTDNPEVFVQFKALEYLNFTADVYGVSTEDRQQRIEKYTTLFELDSVLNTRIGSFSHGMKQKLLIAASLIHEPELWILDEPIVGLDPQSAFRLKTLMKEYSSRGKTVFFSTHIMEIAEKLCDRLAIIHKGKLVFCGSLQQLREQQGGSDSLEQLFLTMTEAGMPDVGSAAAARHI